jgi:ubiquinone/menaquinone biosynthesis C-methylase UbiE
VDAAESMLTLARQNVSAADFSDRIALVLADAKQLPFTDGVFSAVISNSIVHHIAEPVEVLREIVRVAAPSAFQFHRDLCRPDDEATLENLIATYARDSTEYQRRLFAESLRAALTLKEMRSFVERLPVVGDLVMTSDRHWTWTTGPISL